MPIEKITIKELALKMNISFTSAQRLYSDVKKDYGIKIVTISHIHEYLKIPIPQNYS